MQSPKFESLISPPWPAMDKQASEDDHPTHHDQEDLTNFERNNQSESDLDNTAILGYN